MLTQRARRVYLLKRAGMSRQAMPRQTLMHVEGARGVGVEQGMKIEEMHQTYMCPNTPETRCSIDSNE